MSYTLYEISLNTKTTLTIKNNYLVSTSFLTDFIEHKLEGKRFFFINLRSISEDLVRSVPVFKSVFIRRYLIPENKLIVYLVENISVVTSSFYQQNNTLTCLEQALYF